MTQEKMRVLKTFFFHQIEVKGWLEHKDITHQVSKISPMYDVTHDHRVFLSESILHTIMRFCQIF
jgi:hypothetical protein